MFMWRWVTSAAVCVVLASGGALAEQIAPGVEYTVYNLIGPSNVVHVVSIDRLQSQYKLAVGFPQKKRNFTSRQATSTIAGLYDNPPGYDVLAATNGSFFGGTDIDIIGTAASDGELLEQPDAQYDTFLFGPSRAPAIVSDIAHGSGTLTFANGVQTALGYYNRPNPPIHDITAYTPGWDSSTRSSFISPSLAVEVILENVSYPMRGDKEVSGVVTALRTNALAANNPIPAGGMVLTAWGSSKDAIMANTQVGDRLRMWFDTTANDFNNADMAITGIGWVVHNGAAYTSNWANRSAGAPYNRHPRTVLACSETHLYQVVCDGRSEASAGMTFAEMASFLINTLGVTEAVNLDGGGSSTMVVNGTVRNVPSDGSERLVANAVLLVKRDTSTVFPVNDAFGPAGRVLEWDDKFTYHDVVSFSPASPGGDGYVIKVQDPAGGADTTRCGDFDDTDYTVEADIYCDHRPDVSGDGFERYGLFARDSGTGAFGLSSYGGGNCYAMTYDSHDGRLRAAKFINGGLVDFLEDARVYLPASEWRHFRIDCYGSTIEYRLDGTLICRVDDTTHPRGYVGIGHHEFFTTNSLARGTRADNFLLHIDPLVHRPGDFDFDLDVDLVDFAHLQVCLSGSNIAQNDPLCLDARLDGDSDVDDVDVTLFRGCLTGANLPSDPDCVWP